MATERAAPPVMAGTPFRVGYLHPPAHPAFLDEMANCGEVELQRLDRHDDEAALALLATCDGFYVHSARDEVPPALRVTATLLQTLPRLRLVATYGAGYDTVDVPACTAAGIAVVNQAGGNAEAVAEHALMMMLAVLKKLGATEAAIRGGTAERREALMGRELAGRTVGLVGLGHVGTRMAQILAVFGCRVLATDPAVDGAACRARGAEKVELAELLQRSDLVSLHCPLATDTRGLFDAARFAAMRAGSIFVSTARGGVHDERALEHALRSGHLAGAGLDVWEREPPKADHPLLHHPCVVVTNHMAGVTQESRERVGRMAAQAFMAAARHLPLPRLMNPSATAQHPGIR